MSPEDLMRQILALDPGASLMFSVHTSQWYVSADIGISNGTTVTGITEHVASPEAALAAYFNRLTEVDTDRDDYLVAKPFGERREYRWNGAAFAEIPTRQSLPVGAS